MAKGPTKYQARVLVRCNIDPKALAEKPRADITTMMYHMLKQTKKESQERSSVVLSYKYKKRREEIIKELGLKPGTKVLVKQHKWDQYLSEIKNITPEGYLKLTNRKDLVSPTRIKLLPAPIESLP